MRHTNDAFWHAVGESSSACQPLWQGSLPRHCSSRCPAINSQTTKCCTATSAAAATTAAAALAEACTSAPKASACPDRCLKQLQQASAQQCTGAAATAWSVSFPASRLQPTWHAAQQTTTTLAGKHVFWSPANRSLRSSCRSCLAGCSCCHG